MHRSLPGRDGRRRRGRRHPRQQLPGFPGAWKQHERDICSWRRDRAIVSGRSEGEGERGGGGDCVEGIGWGVGGV